MKYAGKASFKMFKTRLKLNLHTTSVNYQFVCVTFTSSTETFHMQVFSFMIYSQSLIFDFYYDDYFCPLTGCPQFKSIRNQGCAAAL